jgi:hypothetical protein
MWNARRVVENVGEAAVAVADGQRIVGDRALREDLLVALSRHEGRGRLGDHDAAAVVAQPDHLVLGDRLAVARPLEQRLLLKASLK